MRQTSPAEAAPRCTRIVLLAEDDAMLRRLVSDRLRAASFAVLETSSGEGAVGLLAAGHGVDLLVTDIQMEGQLSGWDLAEKARQLMPRLPVIYTSSGRCEPLRLVTGGRFVEKPFRVLALVELAKSALQTD